MVDVLHPHCALTSTPKEAPQSYSYITCGVQVPHNTRLPINREDDLVFHALSSCCPLSYVIAPNSFKYSTLRSTWEAWRQPTQKLIIDFNSDQYIGTTTDSHCSGTISAKKLPNSVAIGNALWQSETLITQSFSVDRNANSFALRQ